MDSYLVPMFRNRDVESKDASTAQIPPSQRINPSQIVTHNGWSVQLRDGSYMYIRSWKKGPFNQTLIRGYKLIVPTTEDHCIQLQDKELLWVIHTDNRGHSIMEQERYASEVVRNCLIVFTNQQYGSLNYQTDAKALLEPLYFCRLKRFLPPATEMYPKRGDPSRHLRGSVEYLRAQETHDGHRLLKDGNIIPIRITDKESRDNWRGVGQTVLKGSHQEHVYENISFQQYTMADSFCGAGGASQGALDAGLKINWAFDMDSDAMATYTKRFRGRSGTECLLEECADFLARVINNPTGFIIDILHLSPPCQPFSPANTVPNEEKNAINHATFTTVEDLVRCTRPRVVTLEESHALEWPSHREWFNKLLSMFLGLGYSVRWAILGLSDYGVPQTRKRLIVVASGPGEILPSIPMPTHGTGLGLHPPPTIFHAISDIPFDALDHDLQTTHHLEKDPLDPMKLSGTIKCSGNSENVYHPSGLRYYTVREMASIQTFPIDYEFIGKKCSQSRQVGNAYPPLAAKVIFSGVRKFLLKADEEEMAGNGNSQ